MWHSVPCAPHPPFVTISFASLTNAASSVREHGGAEMVILRIEHPVPDYEGWKRAFESDPVGRQRSGVRRYTILRAADDPNYVMIDLEFDTQEQAEALLAAMRQVWSRVQGSVMSNPQARIAEVVERTEY